MITFVTDKGVRYPVEIIDGEYHVVIGARVKRKAYRSDSKEGSAYFVYSGRYYFGKLRVKALGRTVPSANGTLRVEMDGEELEHAEFSLKYNSIMNHEGGLYRVHSITYSRRDYVPSLVLLVRVNPDDFRYA